MRRLAWGICLAIAAVSGRAEADGRLSRAKDAATGSSSSSGSSHSRSSSGGSGSRSSSSFESYDDDDDDDSPIADAIGHAIVSLISAAVRGDGKRVEYSAHPYASELGAYILPEASELAYLDQPRGYDQPYALHATRAQPWAGQLALDGGYFAGVGHTNLDLRLLTPSRWELQLRGSMMVEPSARDYAVLAGGDVGYRIVQTGAFMMRLLLGIRYFGALDQGAFGADAGVGFDLFLGRPVVLSATLTGGGVGSAALIDARGQLGVMLSRIELFTGFEYLRIGPSQLSSPVLGARLWL